MAWPSLFRAHRHATRASKHQVWLTPRKPVYRSGHFSQFVF
jgi:hypothetical protein